MFLFHIGCNPSEIKERSCCSIYFNANLDLELQIKSFLPQTCVGYKSSPPRMKSMIAFQPVNQPTETAPMPRQIKLVYISIVPYPKNTGMAQMAN